jgi:hypothetical protein
MTNLLGKLLKSVTNRRSCNKFVISAGAKRSGEICGFDVVLAVAGAKEAAEKVGFAVVLAVAGALQAAEKCGDFP